MELKVKVSIIVPVYNVEKYLARCLDSLVNQSLKGIEVIVINDGATDGSRAIITEYEKNFPGLIKGYDKENGGLSDARNFGMQFCSGEYIGFVDSDDYVSHEMYEQMYDMAVKEDSDMVICDYYKVYSNTNILVKARSCKNKKDMYIGALASVWNKLYKRKWLMETEIQFPKGLIYEDTSFFCKLIPHIDRVSYISHPFVYYIQRAGSISNSQGEKVLQIFSIFDDILGYYDRYGYIDLYKDQLEYYCVRIAFGSNLERICRISDKKVRKKILQITIERTKELFPSYKDNRYIKGSMNPRHLFISILRPWNAAFFAGILHQVFKQKDKRLLG